MKKNYIAIYTNNKYIIGYINSVKIFCPCFELFKNFSDIYNYIIDSKTFNQSYNYKNKIPKESGYTTIKNTLDILYGTYLPVFIYEEKKFKYTQKYITLEPLTNKPLFKGDINFPKFDDINSNFDFSKSLNFIITNISIVSVYEWNIHNNYTNAIQSITQNYFLFYYFLLK